MTSSFPNVYVDDQDPPILHAALNGNLELLEELLGSPDKAEHLECKNWTGCGALRLAATGMYL